MNVVYYYVLYLRKESKKTPGKSKVEIHLDPFDTQAQAESYKKKCDAKYGKMVHKSLIKKVDLSKHPEGVWIK